MRHRSTLLAAVLTAVILGVGWAEDKPKVQLPGPTDKGFLLPNGWTLTPAGRHVVLTDLPLNIIPLAGGRQGLVGNRGLQQDPAAGRRWLRPAVKTSTSFRSSISSTKKCSRPRRCPKAGSAGDNGRPGQCL